MRRKQNYHNDGLSEKGTLFLVGGVVIFFIIAILGSYVKDDIKGFLQGFLGGNMNAPIVLEVENSSEGDRSPDSSSESTSSQENSSEESSESSESTSSEETSSSEEIASSESSESTSSQETSSEESSESSEITSSEEASSSEETASSESSESTSSQENSSEESSESSESTSSEEASSSEETASSESSESTSSQENSSEESSESSESTSSEEASSSEETASSESSESTSSQESSSEESSESSESSSSSVNEVSINLNSEGVMFSNSEEFEITPIIKNAIAFDEVHLVLEFDTDFVEVVDVDLDVDGIQIASSVMWGDLISMEIDNTNGLVELEMVYNATGGRVNLIQRFITSILGKVFAQENYVSIINIPFVAKQEARMENINISPLSEIFDRDNIVNYVLENENILLDESITVEVLAPITDLIVGDKDVVLNVSAPDSNLIIVSYKLDGEVPASCYNMLENKLTINSSLAGDDGEVVIRAFGGLSSVANGQHNLFVCVNDNIGNYSSVVSHEFTVGKVASVVTPRKRSGGGGGGGGRGISSYNQPLQSVQNIYGDMFSSLKKNIVAEIEQDSPFTDVVSTHWLYNEILRLYDKGIIKGYSDKSFRLLGRITRAEMAKVALIAGDVEFDIYDVYEKSSFSDIEKQSWMNPVVRIAKENSIVRGYPDGEFKPQNSITRAEALKILIESIIDENIEIPQVDLQFKDTNDIAWLNTYLQIAVNEGLIENQEAFDPDSPIVRMTVVDWMSKLVK